MKTPEEIKKGLDVCSRSDAIAEHDECEGCPYYNNEDQIQCGINTMMKDSLFYIDQLEERINLNALRDAIYEDAVAHGLWESADYNVLCGIEVWKRVGDLFDPDEAMRGQATQIIRSEVDELDAASDEGEKYAEELSDVIIAALSVSGKLGIDIDAEVRRKMDINKERPWKHGKEEQAR